MAYADRDNIDALLGGDALRKISRRLIDRCMSRADAIIDAKLYAVYGVPFSSPYPDMVILLAENLSLYYIYTFLSYGGIPGNTDEIRKELWDSSMELLDKIANGEILLPDVTTTSSSTTSRRASLLTSTTEDYQPVFDLDNEIEWEVDADLLDDIDDRRD